MWPRKSSKKAADKAAKQAVEKPSKKARETPAPVARAAAFQKPRPDLYTVLLVVALLALLLGILFLCLEMNAYDFKFKGGPTPPVGMIQYERPGAMHPGMAAPRQSDRMTVV